MSAINDAPKVFGVEVPSFIVKALKTFTKKEGPISIEDTEFFSGETGAYLDDISDSGPLP